jgi:hypothetical protein
MIRELLSEADVKSIQRYSTGNRSDIGKSSMCGCFHCLEIFPASEIAVWLNEQGGTALCPKCTVDSVLGDKSASYATDKNVLRQLHAYWFEK